MKIQQSTAFGRMLITHMSGFSGARMSDEDTRRFTRLYDHQMPQQISEEGMRQLREYITRDLEVSTHLRAAMLPPQPHRPTILEVAVRMAIATWSKK